MVQQVFEYIGAAPEEIEFSVKVSMIEIYREKIRDLIEPS
jgi:kinesin family protein 5